MKNIFLFLLFCVPWLGFSQTDTIKIHKKSKHSIREVDVYFPCYYDARYERPEGPSEISHKILLKTWNYKRTGLSFLTGFIGGASWGIHETITYHYSSFEKVHPNADPQWWNPSISWNNKNTSSLPFARDFMVVFTDAKHGLAALNTASLVGGTLVVTLGDKRKWYEYVIDLGSMFIGRSLGFQITYNGIYKTN